MSEKLSGLRKIAGDILLALFALDVRFDIFNGWKPVILKATGLVIRVVVILLSAVIMFFCRKLSLT